MLQEATIYNNAHASDSIGTLDQPSVLSFEALGEALVHTDSVMYRQAPSDSLLTAEAIAIYGPLTESVAPQLHDRSAINTPFTATGSFQSCVLLLLLAYVLLLYRFRSDIVELMTNRKAIAEEIEYAGQGSVYGRFFSTTVGVGMLMAAIMIVKGSDLAPQLMCHVVAPQWIYALAVPSVLLAALAVTAIQSAMLWLIGRVAMCEDVTSTLLRLRKISFSILTICCTPAILLYALSEIYRAKVFLYLIGIEAIICFLVFLYETFDLFISKKISVLHWILYLCTVELFPVSLIVLTAMREF
ncbi:MAG: DUF4271 domain-containing protein [Rikenellaceae bacterium]|nr:DUF4271 domain-containing protein [Rikenellaceae bacterium]